MVDVNPWVVDVEDVPHLIEMILNPSRSHSLVLVSKAGDTGRPRIDVDALQAAVEDLPADLVLLGSMEASQRLSDSISEQFHCYGGSVRVVMPGARVTDHFRRHPLVLVYKEDDPKRSVQRVVERVERTPAVTTAPEPLVPAGKPPAPKLGESPVAIPKPGPPPGALPCKPTPLAPPSSPGPSPEAERSPATTTTNPPPATDALDTPAGVGAEERRPEPVIAAGGDIPVVASPQVRLPFGLEEIEQVVTRSLGRVLEEQLGGPSSETERERSRADTAEEELVQAQERIRRLEDELREARLGSGPPVVYSDPVKQLRFEVQQHWLTTVPEHLREDSLPSYTFGESFTEGLEHPVVPRAKTVQVMVAILTGEGWKQYETHQFTEGKTGPARQSPDGTPVLRTYVKENTPQAPRLTWWHTKTRGFHFDHVGPHDELL